MRSFLLLIYLIKTTNNKNLSLKNIISCFSGKVVSFPRCLLTPSNIHCKSKCMKSTGYTLMSLGFFYKVMPFPSQEITWTLELQICFKNLPFLTSVIYILQLSGRGSKDQSKKYGDGASLAVTVRFSALYCLEPFPVHFKGLQKRAFITFIGKWFPSLAADSHQKKKV